MENNTSTPLRGQSHQRNFQVLPAAERFFFIYSDDTYNKVSVNLIGGFLIEQKFKDKEVVYETKYINEFGYVCGRDNEDITNYDYICRLGDVIPPSYLEWPIHCCTVGNQDYRDLIWFKSLGGKVLPPESEEVKIMVYKGRTEGFFLYAVGTYWSLGSESHISDYNLDRFRNEVRFDEFSKGSGDMRLSQLYRLLRFLEELTGVKRLKVEFIPKDDQVPQEIIDTLTYVANYEEE